MYKSRLQELCHQQLWNLPVYDTAKQGLDHNPSFQSTVTVNGQSFTNQNRCRASKEAQNDAARVAFEYFSSPPTTRPPSSVPADSSSNGSLSGSAVQLGVQETARTTQVNVAIPTANDVYRSKDMQHLYKNQLQNFAQKKNLPLPMYSCEREGPSHASRFKCKVTIEGQTYESQLFFPTLKEAEHDAAKVALTSLSPDIQQDDSILYKNLLQELAQKEGYALPVYNTKMSGESHVPIFVSTVEVEAEIFSGKEAKTKKLAEMSAAKVAYISLKERTGNPNQSPALVSPAIQAQTEYSSSSSLSHFTADLQHNVQPAGGMVLNPSSRPKELAEENKVKAESNGLDISQFPQPVLLSSSSDISASNVAESSKSPSSLASEGTFNPFMDSSVSPVGTGASTRKVIRICPNVPNMKFPEGSSVLHRDDNWVAWKLESQSNQ